MGLDLKRVYSKAKKIKAKKKKIILGLMGIEPWSSDMTCAYGFRLNR